MEPQKSRIAKTILRGKNKARGMTLPEFRQYYKGTEIKTANAVAQKQTYESMGQIESLRINSHTYSPLI